jgi:glycosyltransferase involved in cell wall biosynthesis
MRRDRIRVMHLVACNFFGGPEKQILKQAQHLDSDIFEPILASFTDGERETEFLRRARGERIKTLPIRTKNAYDTTSVKRIRQALLENDIDLFCTHTYRPNILGLLATRGMTARQIAFSRGWTKDNLKVQFYHWLDRKLLRRVEHIVAVSQAKKKELLKLGIAAGRITVIPNAVEIPSPGQSDEQDLDLRKEYNLPTDCRLVAACGRLSPEKGHTVFLEMAEIVRKRCDNVRFMIVGDGPLRERLELLGIDLLETGELVLTGYLPGFSRYFPQVDILVNASFSEGMPNVVLEALSYARPVVATEVGGVGELIEHGRTGFLSRAGDAEELADRVGGLLEKPEVMKRMGEAGREFVARNHSFPAQAEKLKVLYLKVAGVQAEDLKVQETETIKV